MKSLPLQEQASSVITHCTYNEKKMGTVFYNVNTLNSIINEH